MPGSYASDMSHNAGTYLQGCCAFGAFFRSTIAVHGWTAMGIDQVIR